MRRIILCSQIILFSFFNVNSQENQVYNWIDHLPYNSCHSIISTKNTIIAATDYSLIELERNSNSLSRLSKITGLSDFGVSALAYDQITESIIVGYTNGNIDLIKNSQIINMSDIKRSDIIGDKAIYSIEIYEDVAYLGTGFGIIAINLEKEEIKDTYFLESNNSPIKVNAIHVFNSDIYVSTDSKFLFGSINDPFLSLPESWTEISSFTKNPKKINLITSFQNRLYVNYSSETFRQDSVFEFSNNSWELVRSLVGKTNYFIKGIGDRFYVSNSYSITVYDNQFEEIYTVFTYPNKLVPQPRGLFIENDTVWIADNSNGIIKSYGTFNNKVYQLNSPNSITFSDIQSDNGLVVTSAGGVYPNGNRFFNYGEIHFYENGEWSYLNKSNADYMDSIRDIVQVKIDPNNSDIVYGASLLNGILKFENKELANVFNESNTQGAIKYFPGYGHGIMDVEIDAQGQLWAVNNFDNNALTVFTENSSYRYNFSDKLSNNGLGKLMITENGDKWLIILRKGILVFNENNSPDDFSDDASKLLTTGIGSGNLPSEIVLSIAEDLDGEVWVGTDIGLRVIYSPGNILSENGAFDAEDILIKQDIYTQVLLENQSITSIAIDAANRKWIGTSSSGVYLLSGDGTEEIFHFTEDNSPIFSNEIIDIEVNHNNGEVFIATNNGMIGFKGSVTKSETNYESILAYPNPIREGYNGYISIKGLVKDSQIRITNVAGDIVYKAISEGGQVIWDGLTEQGEYVKNGIYLVFATSPDGTDAGMTKIMVLK